MASIIVDLSDDIKKIQSLKEEIQQVKKELGSINVNVHLDIKRDMEARLKSLTDQYDALVQKVAQAEAKIAESTARINKSAETVIKAQEQMTKAASGQGVANAQGASGGNTTATNAETASVQAQAKAYDELANEIDAVMGTRSQNIRRMIEEQNAIRIINEEIKKLTKYQSGNSTLSASQQKRLEQLNASLLTHKTALSELRQSLNNSFKLDAAAATSMNALSQSLARMRMTYRELTEEERNSTFGKELLASIQQADAKIKQLDATIGNHQRNVGNYASGWNGLGMSIQQIGRELPSLAMGWNTFFLAISNNLPILTDEIKRAKDEYNRLKEAGQQATPVWKQVVSSLLSWQTALTVGITLLTLYGKDIIEWVGNLFKAKDGTEELTEATKRMNTAISGVYSSASEEMRVLKDLNTSLENAKRGTEEWNQIRNRLITGYSKYLPSIDQEIQKTGTLADSYDKLAESIQKAAAARGFEEYSSESNKKYMDERNKRIEEVYDAMIDELGNDEGNKLYQEWLKVLDSGMRPTRSQAGKFGNIGVGFGLGNANSVLIDLQNLLDANNETIDKFRKMFGMTEGAEEDLPSDSIKAIQERITANREALEKLSTSSQEYRDLLQSIQKDEERLQNLTMKPDAQSKQYNSIQDQQDKINELLDKQAQERIKNQVEMENRVSQAEIDAMADGAEKVRAQRELDNKKELEEIIRQKNEYIKEQINAQKEIFDAQEELKAKENSKYKKKTFNPSSVNVDTSSFDMLLAFTQARQTSDYFNEQENAMNRYLKDYGTFQERKKAIVDEYNQKIAVALTKGDKLILQKQMEKALSDLDMEKLKESINWELVFSDLGNASKKSLQQVKKKLDDFKSSDEYKNMAIDQKKVIDEALNNIQSAIIDKGGLLGDLPNQLKELREAQDELTAAQDEYNEAMKNGTDEQKEAAQRKLNKAEQNVANAQSNTDKAAKRTTDNLLTLADALTQLGSNTEMTLSEVGQLAGGIANAFSEAGSKIGGIIGAIFSILDQVGQEGLFGFLGNVFESVGNALTGVFDSLLGWTGIDFGGESDPTLEQDIERLTLANQELEKAINNLTEKMDDAAVADASSIYEVQKKNIEEQMKNTQEMMERSASASTSGFLGIGGHHSTDTKINRGMTDEDWEAISEAVGRSVTSANEFFNLTSEEMWRVANEASSEYAKLKGLADDGYKDAAQFMDEYIEYWQELEELEEAYNEKLTSVSFDTIKDDFRNALLGMEDSTEAFADNFEKMMQQAILESMMTGTYDKALQEWYQDFADAMKDGTLDEDEQDMLRKQWQDIVDSASEEWQGWRDLMGWEADGEKEQQQQASAGYSIAASQDSVDVLNGRLNAMYECELRIEENGRGLYNIADEARSIIAQSYLELQRIGGNTEAVIKPIKQMQQDIAKVKENTARI